MHFKIAFSPCPNDTFIFDALVNKKIDTGLFSFEPVFGDVETLNQWALEGKFEITKLSYGVLPQALANYTLLSSGSALGRGVGPLLIYKPGLGLENKLNDSSVRVAIPGEHTTAHMLFSLAYPQITSKIFMRYDEIENFVLSGQGLGVIIHENRFTYEDKGLKKIKDLGEYWELETQHPVPLGGIVIKRSIDHEMQKQISALIRKSIEFAYDSYPALSNFVTEHAQEMSEAVMRKHIRLYVNDFSINLGEEGRLAVQKLIEVNDKLYSCHTSITNLFAD